MIKLEMSESQTMEFEMSESQTINLEMSETRSIELEMDAICTSNAVNAPFRSRG